MTLCRLAASLGIRFARIFLVRLNNLGSSKLSQRIKELMTRPALYAAVAVAAAAPRGFFGMSRCSDAARVAID